MNLIEIKKITKIYILKFVALITCLIFSNLIYAQSQNIPTTNEYYPDYPKINQKSIESSEIIQRGEYLAKMGDCIACHTHITNDATPKAFAGGLPIATPFGTLYSPNITPDMETGIGTWSVEDFIRAMKHGRDPQGRNYFPVFPYIYFSKISDADLRALYVYFMNIPPIKQPNQPLPFPFNLPGSRFAMWGWNMLFFFNNEHAIIHDPNKSPSWNRGRYIVDGLGHCGMCHTPLNVFGAPKVTYYLTGGFIDNYWAPNITKYGLHTADHAEIANVFKNNELINRAGPVMGPMAEVNHNSLQYLTAEDKIAIATYLKTVVSEEPVNIPQSSMKPTLERGKQVYVNSCIACHQDGKMSAPIIGHGANWYHRLQHNGLAAIYRHAIYGYNSMPVKGACVTCSDEDIMAATDYILNTSLSRAQWHALSTGRISKSPPDGKIVYAENCASCHNDGNQGAPKIGDRAVWRSLLAQNMDVLIDSAINGHSHPRNAGCIHCTSAEIIEAIKYMVSQSKTEGNYSLW